MVDLSFFPLFFESSSTYPPDLPAGTRTYFVCVCVWGAHRCSFFFAFAFRFFFPFSSRRNLQFDDTISEGYYNFLPYILVSYLKSDLSISHSRVLHLCSPLPFTPRWVVQNGKSLYPYFFPSSRDVCLCASVGPLVCARKWLNDIAADVVEGRGWTSETASR